MPRSLRPSATWGVETPPHGKDQWLDYLRISSRTAFDGGRSLSFKVEASFLLGHFPSIAL
jgi:hypothetical protein